MNNYTENRYKYIVGALNSATTTTVFTGRGELVSVTIGNPTNSPVAVFDDTYVGLLQGTNTVFSIRQNAEASTHILNIVLGTGCRVYSAGNSDITITYREY